MPLVVAIDGPAGSGKSTLARALARRLGWAYLDTGAMYRAVTALALEGAVDLQDTVALARLARSIDLHLDPRDGRVEVDGRDLTSRIRTADVNATVSTVAAVPEVREVMVRHQRRFADENERVVAEGRDIGTVVFPDARLKLYLDASPDERARRRIAEGDATGGDEAPETVRSSIERRDRLDRERRVAPLRQADDAVVLVTTHLDPDQVLEKALAEVHSRVPPPAGG
jgi:cytidylate kinase